MTKPLVLTRAIRAAHRKTATKPVVGPWLLLCLAVATVPELARAEVSGPREPAPRPVADVRVQPRFVQNAGQWRVFAGVDYYERRDYYLSPGVELGVAHSLTEALALELQAHHFFSSLNSSAADVSRKYGVLPDSLAPAWLLLADVRYNLGYGKVLLEGVRRVVHFEPQAVLGVGVHVNGGQFGPSALLGLGLAFHLTPAWFLRIEGALGLDGESVGGRARLKMGFLPALTFGANL